MHNLLQKFPNVTLRLFVLILRFMLLVVMARNMEIADVASYGLFVASIGYGLLIVGLDFYNYSNREILKDASYNKAQMIKSQFVLTLISYSLIIPVMTAVLFNLGFNESFLVWFVILLILEHLNQEIYRLTITLGHQLYATYLLFGRQGLWAIIVIYEVLIHDRILSLNHVLSLWAASSFVCLVFGIIKLDRLKLLSFQYYVAWEYLSRGVKVSFALFVGTVALRGIQTADRFWIALVSNQDVVAAYVVFMSIAGALFAFLDAGIFSFSYPKLIQFYNDNNEELFWREFKTLLIQTVVTCAVFCLAIYLFTPLILEILDKDEYNNNIEVLYWSLAFVISYGLSMIPHFALYARCKDKAIIISHVSAAGLMVVLFLISYFSAFSTKEILYCILLVNISVLLMKSAYMWQVIKRSIRLPHI